MLTDAEFLLSVAHIPDSEVAQDIRDTEDEIYALRREIRMREQGIEERQAFIAKLRHLQELRAKAGVV